MNLPANLQIQPEALQDIIETVEYYNSIQTGLANKFITQLESDLAKVCGSPNIHINHNGVYKFKLSKFNFLIYYINEKGKIIVLRIFHTSRNPI